MRLVMFIFQARLALKVTDASGNLRGWILQSSFERWYKPKLRQWLGCKENLQDSLIADVRVRTNKKEVEDEFRVLSFIDWLEVNTTDLE